MKTDIVWNQFYQKPFWNCTFVALWTSYVGVLYTVWGLCWLNILISTCMMLYQWGIFFFFIPVKSIIDEEIKSGIPSDRIVLGNLRTLSTHIFTSTRSVYSISHNLRVLHYELEENYGKLLHEAGYFWSQDMPLESWLCYNYTTFLILLVNWYQGLKIKKQFTLN